MPATRKSIVDAAEREWHVWGDSVWDLRTMTKKIGHTDDEFEFAAYVLEEYCPTADRHPVLADIRNKAYSWSAVCMSTIMKNAGFTREEFPFAQRHADYVRRFIQARRENDLSAAFWGYRLGEDGSQPDVGDLVAYAQSEGASLENAPGYFDKVDSYLSHTDVVVAKYDDAIEVIGGNVQRSVTKKILPLDPHGHIASHVQYWFAVLKLRLP